VAEREIIRLDSSGQLVSEVLGGQTDVTERVFAVPGEAVSLYKLDISVGEKRHLKKTLPYLLEEQLVADVDTQHLVSVDNSEGQLAVAVVDKAQMERWQSRLDSDSEQADKWLPEPLLLYWHSGALTIVIENTRALVRSGEFEGFATELDSLSAMLQLYCDNAETLPEQVFFYGSEQQQSQHIPEILQSRVSRNDGSFASAVEQSENTTTLNLLQGAFMPRLPWTKWWQNWRPVAILFACAFIVQLGVEYHSYSQLQDRNLALRQQIEQRYRSVFPRGNLVDPEKQMRNQLIKIRGDAQGPGFVSVLNRIGRVVSSQPSATLAAINFNNNNGNVRLSLDAANFSAVESVRTELSAVGLVAELQNSSAQGDGVRARLRLREK